MTASRWEGRPGLPAPPPFVTRWAAAALIAAGLLALPVDSEEQPAVEGVSRAVLNRAGVEGRVMWLDGTANLERLSTRAGVAGVMERCRNAGINTVVVDVKPLSGHILYNGREAPRLKEWRGFKYPEGYDLLQVCLDEGHRRGLKIHAAINVFSSAHKLVRSGPLYDNGTLQATVYDVQRTVISAKGERRQLAMGINRAPDPDQVVAYDSNYRGARTLEPGEVAAVLVSDRVDGLFDGNGAQPPSLRVPINGALLIGKGEGARWLQQNLLLGDVVFWAANDRMLPILEAPGEVIAGFVNPASPDARSNALKVVDEIASRYEVDGIVFDRLRYSSLQSDFSDFSRKQFELFLGKPLEKFPADVLSYEPSPCRSMTFGPAFKSWLEWRARNIRSWLELATTLVRARRPAARLGAYVGSWYNSYYTVGVNWGADDYSPGLDWMTPGYPAAGYAGLLDWICTGCYYPMATREQARGAGLDESYTVQAAAETSARATADSTFVYAGLYVLDYRGAPETFRHAMQAARNYSHGVMLFDLSHIEDFGYWQIVKEEFGRPRPAPHEFPQLLHAVKELRRTLRPVPRQGG